MRKLFFLLAAAFLFGYSNAWVTGYECYFNVTVDSPYTYDAGAIWVMNLSAQLPIADLVANGHLQADYDDLILVYNDTDTIMDFWIEDGADDNNLLIYWTDAYDVTTPVNRIIMLCNPSGTNQENISGVWIWYDDFNDASYTGWTTQDGTNFNTAESGGYLNITSTGATGNIYLTHDYIYPLYSSRIITHVTGFMSDGGGADAQAGPLYWDDNSNWYMNVMYDAAAGDKFRIGRFLAGVWAEKSNTAVTSNYALDRTYLNFSKIGSQYEAKGDLSGATYWDSSSYNEAVNGEYGGLFINLAASGLYAAIDFWGVAVYDSSGQSAYVPNVMYNITASNYTYVNVWYPTNTTYWNSTIVLNWTAWDTGIYSTFPVKYWMDTVLEYDEASFTNDSHPITTYKVNTTGLHNFTLWANGSSADIEYRYFTMADYAAGSVTNSPDDAIEGESMTYYTNYHISDLITTGDAGLWFNGSYVGSATLSQNSTHLLFYKTYVMPEVNPYNQTVTYLFNVSLTYANGTTIYLNSSAGNHELYKVTLTNCSFFSTPTVGFYLFNESDDTPVNGTIEIANDVTYGAVERNYSFTWNSITAANMCIYPYWATYDLYSQIYYYASGFASRTYFIDTQINNETQYVNLYLLNASDAEQVIIYVKDNAGTAVENAVVKVERFYVGSYSYKTVAQISTDFDGKGIVYLDVNSVYYKFVIEQNGTVTREFSPTIIVCQSGSTCPPYEITLTISEDEISEFDQVYGKIGYSCTWNNATGTLSCTGSDTTGIVQSFRLVVDKFGIITKTEECSVSSTSSAVTLPCVLSGFMGNVYEYSFQVYLPNTGWFTLEKDMLDFASGVTNTYGFSGLLVVLVLILTGFFLATGSPTLAIVLPSLMLVFAYMFGLVPVTVTALMGLLVVVGVIIYLMVV